jgi:hypothetical protein
MSENPQKQAGQILADVFKAQAHFVAWLVSLGFGGAMLVLYYNHIRYFPELEWKELLTFLAALSFLGGTIAVLYGFLLFFPGWIWSEFLVHDSKLKEKLRYQNANGNDEACYRAVALHMALPFLVFMAVMHIVALFKVLWITAVVAIALLAVISVALKLIFQRTIGETNPKSPSEPGSTGSLLLKYVGLFDVSALISLASLLFLYALIDPSKESPWMLTICTVAVVVTNFLVAVQYRLRPGRAVVTAILATLVLLRCGESESLVGKNTALSSQLMAGFGVGEHQQVTLVVKDEALKILQAHGIQPDSRFGLPTVRNAYILSRLGRDYFIGVGGRRVAIPRDLVVSWSASNPSTP